MEAEILQEAAVGSATKNNVIANGPVDKSKSKGIEPHQKETRTVKVNGTFDDSINSYN